MSGESSTDSYLRTLLLLLLAATFFEGFDGAILTFVLPGIRDTFNVAESQLGVSRAIIELGLGAAFFLARAGDRIGRRKLLMWSVFGYTLMTALTAFSNNLWTFTAFQSLSRVFLGAEYAVAITMIVEEFPPARRGRALGTLLMCSAIGAIVVPLLLLAGIDSGPLEWRALYLVGIGPLLFLAFYRRRLRETRRFAEHLIDVARGVRESKVSFFEPWRPAFRRALLLVGIMSLLRSLPLFGATSWFIYYAEREAGIGAGVLYPMFIVAYGFGTLGYLACGRLMERIGRRPTALLYGAMTAVGATFVFQARSPAVLGILLVLAVFFGLGQAPVLGAISTELFPTYIRNQSAAWARNVFEIAGFILGPLLVGVLGDHYTGAIGSLGDAVSMLVLLTLPALWLVWRHLPETKGRELEEIEAELGMDVAGAGRWSSQGRVRAAATGIGVVVVLAAGLVFGLRALGDTQRRPEGAAERFLQAVSSHDDANIELFGSPDLARQLVPEPSDGDDEFETIEIGAAAPATCGGRVPFRVEPEKGRGTLGTLVVSGCPGDELIVTSIDGSRPELRLPSDGGPAPRGAGPGAWLLAGLAVLLVGVVCELVLRILGRRTAAD